MPSERIQRRIDKLLDQAEHAADELDWALVRDLADRVLKLDDGNSDAADLIRLSGLRCAIGVQRALAERNESSGTTGFAKQLTPQDGRVAAIASVIPLRRRRREARR